MRYCRRKRADGSFRAPTVRLGVFLLLLAGCSSEPPPPVEESARLVRYIEAQPQGDVRRRTFSGAAKAGVESEISFRVSGSLEKLEADIGDHISRGDLIAALDPVDYELRVEQARASLAQAEAQSVKAQADFERTRGLYERDNASRADYDATRAAWESAKANVNAIAKQLEQSQMSVRYTTLRSPIDGVVAEAPVEVNENVQAGQPIVILNSGPLPEVTVAIPEILIGDIEVGQIVPEITFDAIPGRIFRGRVYEIAPTSTQGLTTYPVTIRLEQTSPRILPGMAAEVTFLFTNVGGGERFVTPPQAVGEDAEGRRYVFVVKPTSGGNGVVERRNVSIGDLVTASDFGEGLEILSGLRAGDLVVTAGVSQISDGAEVRLAKDSL